MQGKLKGQPISARFLFNDRVAPAHRSHNQNYPPFYTGTPVLSSVMYALFLTAFGQVCERTNREIGRAHV